jgi:predicted TIM-barrel fold metal-dependent hydrolase
MNIAVREQTSDPQATRLAVVDCDIHPQVRSPADLQKYLPERWRKHMATYSNHVRQALSETLAYPRMTPDVARRDAWPANGGPPGSDLEFMRQQHLDLNGVEYGILIALRNGGTQRNLDYGAALCRAVNEWQVEQWLDREPRLRGSLAVHPEDPVGAVKEIERASVDKRFVQVLLPPRMDEPAGRRRYWPIYEAAVRAGLPIGMHVGGVGGHPATAGSGPASYYIEEHHSLVPAMQAVVTSMVLEGVFEHFPALKVALVEGSFAWVPSLTWRLDKHWNRMKDEVPHLTRKPSEYVREHFWFTTQPIDEPENPQDLFDVMSWIGWDRLMFSTDYPHWDFDDPRYVFKAKLEEPHRSMLFRDNAKALYGLA